MASKLDGFEGGYEYKFVEPPPERLVCKICHFPCRNTRLSSCCGHAFCESCLGQAQSSHSTSQACPMCRSEKFDVYPQLEADREIKALLIYCLNENKGCTWIGELSSLLDKSMEGCMKCDKCKEVIHYTDVTSHFIILESNVGPPIYDAADACPCYCQYCKITAERELIGSKHKDKCHKFPVTCPNNCDLVEKIPRDAMDDHRMECPLEMIQCCQCGAEITRNSKEKHDDENKIKHLQILCNEKFDSVFNELQTITVSIDNNKQEVVQMVQDTSSRIMSDQLLFVRSKLFVAVLCVVIAILMMAIYTKDVESTSTVDMLKVVDKGLDC